jgi:hypothetical protein
VRLVVLHCSEGATTYSALGNFFANPSSGVSSHVGIDDAPGTVGEYVRRDYSAWTAAGANPYAVQAELCVPSGASAGWSAADWNRHPTMLENCGRWVAEECAAFGIPLRILSPSEAQGGAAGVCQHRDLGAWGGNHSDCGDGFPIDTVLHLAADGGTGEDDMTPEQAAQLDRVDKLVSENHTRLVRLEEYAFGRLDGLVGENHTRLVRLEDGLLVEVPPWSAQAQG